MGRKRTGEAKKQGGISLPRFLWERIERAADDAGVSKNRVMERALLRQFGFAVDSQNPQAETQSAHGGVEWGATNGQ